MNCKEATKLVDAYLDAELDPVTSQQVEQHLRDCRRCEEAYGVQRSLITTIETSAPYYRASSDLRRRIHSSLQDHAGINSSRRVARTSELTPKQSHPRRILSVVPWNWLALAAAVVLTAIITLNVMPRRHGADQFLATQLIASR